MLAVEHADAGRPVELVAGDGVEVAADVLHVDIEVDGGLGAVEQHRNAAGMRTPHHLLHRHQGAEHVRHMGDRDHPGARRKQLLEFVDEEISLVIDRSPFDHRALALAQEVPRHDVGMVLHDREHDLVAGLDALAAERVGHQVDGLGGVAGEDDLFLAGRVEEGAHLLARILVGFGRGIGEIVQPAVHVGVFGGIGVLQAIEHGLRLLRRGGIVEIDERLAVDLQREDRKILADAVHVIRAVAHRRVHRSSLPRPEPGDDLVHQRVAQPGMFDAFDRLADEGLDQQRLGLLGGNAARPEVEQ